MSDREVMHQALDALEYATLHARVPEIIGPAITALRKALEQPEQEPVADGNKVICPACCHQFRAIPTAVQTLMLNAGFEPPFVTTPAAQPAQEPVAKLFGTLPVYATPPAAQRQWVGLTDEDMKDPKTHILDFIYGARWAEAKLKERNT